MPETKLPVILFLLLSQPQLTYQSSPSTDSQSTEETANQFIKNIAILLGSCQLFTEPKPIDLMKRQVWPSPFGQRTLYLMFDINMQSMSIIKMIDLSNPYPLII
ncbi:hypothetical protein JHW46_08250 [Vibrio splendidus]|nr:hypothetical protein [Vibrio splendidus]